jgi:hypothetical protein
MIAPLAFCFLIVLVMLLGGGVATRRRIGFRGQMRVRRKRATVRVNVSSLAILAHLTSLLYVHANRLR